jgi:hypothetical protein
VDRRQRARDRLRRTRARRNRGGRGACGHRRGVQPAERRGGAGDRWRARHHRRHLPGTGGALSAHFRAGRADGAARDAGGVRHRRDRRGAGVEAGADGAARGQRRQGHGGRSREGLPARAARARDAAQRRGPDRGRRPRPLRDARHPGRRGVCRVDCRDLRDLRAHRRGDPRRRDHRGQAGAGQGGRVVRPRARDQDPQRVHPRQVPAPRLAALRGVLLLGGGPVRQPRPGGLRRRQRGREQARRAARSRMAGASLQHQLGAVGQARHGLARTEAGVSRARRRPDRPGSGPPGVLGRDSAAAHRAGGSGACRLDAGRPVRAGGAGAGDCRPRAAAAAQARGPAERHPRGRAIHARPGSSGRRVPRRPSARRPSGAAAGGGRGDDGRGGAGDLAGLERGGGQQPAAAQRDRARWCAAGVDDHGAGAGLDRRSDADARRCRDHHAVADPGQALPRRRRARVATGHRAGVLAPQSRAAAISAAALGRLPPVDVPRDGVPAHHRGQRRRASAAPPPSSGRSIRSCSTARCSCC